MSPASPNHAAAGPGEEHGEKDADTLDVVARRIAKAAESEIGKVASKKRATSDDCEAFIKNLRELLRDGAQRRVRPCRRLPAFSYS